ncbi:MAG: group II intron reverse transcriptase/maturase [Acidobacteriota bacterium]
MTDTSKSERARAQSISTKLQRIATLAKEDPQRRLTSLAYYIDMPWLLEAYERTRKDGAPGIDGETGRSYAEHLEANLQDLLNRFKSGRYRAPATRRVHIPKGKGKETRPLGIPTFEDKVLQRAVLMALEAVYEQDFLDCSYGFRPGRSPHQALEELRRQTMRMGGVWAVEVDIRKFFDTVDHRHLREILGQRVRDGVLIRTIGKWLNAGVMEEQRLSYPEKGTPQGGVISPLLANVYLHHVFDVWFEAEVRPRMRGRCFVVRFADDLILGFEHEQDADRVMDVLPKRFGKFGLTLHPTKTKKVDFRRPRKSRDDDEAHPGSFDFLGFTHYWGKSRKGNWVVKQKTARDRLARTARALHQFCRHVRHWKVREQHRRLWQKLRGHDAYFGITGNHRALQLLRRIAERIWKHWLSRRGQRSRMPWARFKRLLGSYPLPRARICHSYIQPHAANP